MWYQPNNPKAPKRNFPRRSPQRLTYVLANIESRLLDEDSDIDAKEFRVMFERIRRGTELGLAVLPPGGARLATESLPTLRLPVLGSLFSFARWLGIPFYSLTHHRVCWSAKYP